MCIYQQNWLELTEHIVDNSNIDITQYDQQNVLSLYYEQPSRQINNNKKKTIEILKNK